MGPLAKKLLRELQKARTRKVIDLSPLREARAFHADVAEHLRTLSDELPPQHLAWMQRFSILASLAEALLAMRPLEKLAERIDDAHETYMPGGPPMSPVLDSLFVSWSNLDLTAGPARESIFSMIADLAGPLSLPRPLGDAARTLAASSLGIYCVRDLGPERVELCDLARGDRVTAATPRQMSRAGDLWLTRLLPPILPGSTDWVVWITPYHLDDPTAEADWLAYFERLEPEPAKRAQRLARQMKSPAEPTYWLDYVMDAYAGCGEAGEILLTGVPDRPETLPHSDHYDPHARPSARAVTPIQRVRDRLARHVSERAIDQSEIDDLRSQLGAPLEPLLPKADAALRAAFGFYGLLDTHGRTALDDLLADAESLPADERAIARELDAGWFSAFEVLHVRVDAGMEVRDHLRNRRLWIDERLATRGVSIGDIIAGWVSTDGQRYRFEGALVHAPAAIAPRLAGALRALREALAVRSRGLGWKKRLGQLAPFAAPLCDAMLARLPPPQLVDRNGHRIVISRTFYDIRDRKRAADGLATRFECVRPEVYARTSDGARVAELAMEPEQLVVRATSREALAATRAELESLLDAAIEHRHDRFEELGAAAAGAAALETGAATDLDPEARKAVHEYMQRYLEEWLDEPIPALGDKTPREAVRSGRGRDSVTHLLVRQQQMLDRNPQTAGTDLRHIWKALGLVEPPR
jgi:hypothetical protein